MGDDLDGLTPIEYTRKIMPKIDPNIALFPPIILDHISTNSKGKSVAEVCAHYKK